MKKYFILLLLIIIAFNTKAQTDSVKQLIENKVEKIITEARKGDPSYWEENINIILLSQPGFTYRILQEYEIDSSKQVIRALAGKYFMLAIRSKDKIFRREVVDHLLSISIKYASVKNDYDPFYILATLSSVGKSFKEEDFNNNSQKKIKQLLKEKPSYSSILLVGLAGLKNQISELKKFLPDGERYKKPGKFYFSSLEWASRLALARLGDKGQIDFCVEKIKSVDLLENSYGYGEYMDCLIYIRKSEVLPYLFELLLANKPFRDEPIYTSSAPAIYALIELLEDFPPEMGYSLTEKGVEEYRKWVEDHKGNYKFKE